MMKCLPTKKLGINMPRYEGPAEVVRIIDKKSYLVKYKGKIYRRHEDSLKKCKYSDKFNKKVTGRIENEPAQGQVKTN